jgi:hypothetical protein
MNTNKNRVWFNAFGNPSARVLIFFCPTRIAPFGRIRERYYQQPTHIAAHLQAPTSQRSIQRLSKELQFCHPTTAKFDYFVKWETIFIPPNLKCFKPNL